MKGFRVDPAFWERLAREIEGEVDASSFARARYATDASIFQCFPAGITCPKHEADVAIIVEMAREEGIAIVPRGGGTSTAGQALGEGLVVDFSRHMTAIKSVDLDGMTCSVEPGVRLAALNARLRRDHAFFPIEIASSRAATLGGMAANNSSGLRSLRFGRMHHRMLSATAILSDGSRVEFAALSEEVGDGSRAGSERLLDLLQLGEAREKEIVRHWPEAKPGEPEAAGYRMRALLPSDTAHELAPLLVGSEGTLGLMTELKLKLARRSRQRAVGVCRFSSLKSALRAVPGIVALNPSAVELMDSAILDFMAERAGSDPQAARLLQGEPSALLIVEFDEENPVENSKLLKALDALLDQVSQRKLPLVEIMGERAQASLWRLRRDALNRAMSLKSAAQPVAFIEDAAIPLTKLEAFGSALEELFVRTGTRALFWGHAGQGCLHVRPILNLNLDADRSRMQAQAEAMTGFLRQWRGAISAGQGVGLVRGALFEQLAGPEALKIMAELKAILDPQGLLNPGKFFASPRFADPALLRPRAIEVPVISGHLAWRPGAVSEGAFEHAARCQGLSLCQTQTPRFVCPSYAVTRNECDSPRGRANTMRAALSGALGGDALSSQGVADTMKLCVSCKACRPACPMGIDIPKMKVETLVARRKADELPAAIALYARLPAFSERARRWRTALRLRDVVPALSRSSERRFGFAADRPWPRWSGKPFRANDAAPGLLGMVALFADTFNQAFEPANLRAAADVLRAAGFGVVKLEDQIKPEAPEAEHPLCCGRTYYDAGLLDQARACAARLLSALAEHRERGISVVGLEPACLSMIQDDYASLGVTVPAGSIKSFEAFIAERAGPELGKKLKPIEATALHHAHCHERAINSDDAARLALGIIPGLEIKTPPASCCGLNGFVGMTSDTFEASLAMAELELFPAIRKAGRDALVSATGFSCRKQIYDGLGVSARHPARLLSLALKSEAEIVN